MTGKSYVRKKLMIDILSLVFSNFNQLFFQELFAFAVRSTKLLILRYEATRTMLVLAN